MSTEKWFVEYKVAGFPGLQKAGPYGSSSEAQMQAKDIQGYEGVHAVEIVERPEQDTRFGLHTWDE